MQRKIIISNIELAGFRQIIAGVKREVETATVEVSQTVSRDCHKIIPLARRNEYALQAIRIAQELKNKVNARMAKAIAILNSYKELPAEIIAQEKTEMERLLRVVLNLLTSTKEYHNNINTNDKCKQAISLNMSAVKNTIKVQRP
ncbi:MAG: hypothetical protein WC838_07025 [Candidatus Margulisiibacteriota bacterium]